MGEEAASLDVNVLLGPGLNIKRSPLCGRNFEYFSEDPYLSGKMAAAFVRGVQENGISACPKHFACSHLLSRPGGALPQRGNREEKPGINGEKLQKNRQCIFGFLLTWNCWDGRILK